MRGFWSIAEAMGLPEVFLLTLGLLVAGRLGHVVIGRISLGPVATRAEKLLFSVAVGWGMLGYATLLFGVLQLYYSWFFRIALGVAAAAALPWWRRVWRDIRAARRASREINENHPESRRHTVGKADQSAGPDERVVVLAAACLLALFGTIYLLAALAPETEFDALNYHLGVPRLYIAQHGIHAVPNLFYSNFPFFTEMLFTLGWLVRSTLLAKLFHFALGMLCAVAMFLFCRRYFSTATALLSVLLFLATPLVGYLFTTAYVDLGLALFAFLSLYTFYVWTECGERGWLVLAGIFSGLALGTKYTGFQVVVLIAAYGGWVLARSRSRPNVDFGRAARCYGAAAFLVFAPWLVKNVVLVKNPVAPFFSEIFQNPAFNAVDYAAWMRFLRDWGGYDGTLWDYLRSPWLLTWQGDIFMGTPGPIYIFFFPLAALLVWRHKALAFLSICAVLGYGLQILGTRQVRFFVPLFPLAGIVIAAALFHFNRRSWIRWLVWSAASAALLLLVVLQLPYFNHLWPGKGLLTLRPESFALFTSEEKRRDYLERHLLGAGTLDFYAFLEEAIPAGEGLFAVTEAYQALTDHPLYVAPNCSPANDLSRKVIEASLHAGNIVTLRLAPRSHDKSRYWKVGLPGVSVISRPRIFRLEGGHPLEVNVFGVERSEREEGWEFWLDLGLPRRVDRVECLVRLQRAATPLQPEAALEVSNGAAWTELDLQREFRPAPEVRAEHLAESMRAYGIRYLFYCALPEIAFVDEFFQMPQTRRHFQLLKEIGDYRLYSAD